MNLSFQITEKETGKSVKEILKQNGISSRLLLTLKRNDCIFLNNKTTSINTVVKENDNILISLNTKETSDNIVPTPMELNIIYEDDAYLIINKPANIAVHPSCQHYDTSLSNGVKYYFNQIGLQKKIRPVNRLDKDTSRNCYIC